MPHEPKPIFQIVESYVLTYFNINLCRNFENQEIYVQETFKINYLLVISIIYFLLYI